MSTALTTTTGAGGTSVAYAKAPQVNGLTYRGWLKQANAKTSKKHYEMWQSGEKPGAAKAPRKNPSASEPMSLGTKVALGVGGTVVAVGLVTGIWWLATRGNKSGTNGTNGGTSSNATWKRATSVNPGQLARISVDANQAAQALGLTGPGAEAKIVSALQSSLIDMISVTNGTLQVYGPTAPPKPADWPADDTGYASEFHAEFRNGGATPIDLAALAGIMTMPVVMWTSGS